MPQLDNTNKLFLIFVPVIIVLGVVLLLTVNRLNQLGTSPVAPTSPQSKPAAAEGSFSCQYNFSVSALTCDEPCTSDIQCQSGLVCNTQTNTCRHPDYPNSESCQPPVTTTASLKVCKAITQCDKILTNWSDLPDTDMSLVLTANDANNNFALQYTFRETDQPNTSLPGGITAHCKNLETSITHTLGTQTTINYQQETITPNTDWSAPKYNDQINTDQSIPEMYTWNQNQAADGQIIITDENTDLALAILNELACPPPSPSPSPSPSPTPTPVPIVCSGIAPNITNPQIGDSINFTCTATGPVTRYEFRYQIDGGQFQSIDASSDQPTQSFSIPISQPGDYQAQCRACNDSTCSDWDTL